MAGLTAPQFLQLPVGMRFISSATVARIASIVCAVICISYGPCQAWYATPKTSTVCFRGLRAGHGAWLAVGHAKRVLNSRNVPDAEL